MTLKDGNKHNIKISTKQVIQKTNNNNNSFLENIKEADRIK